MTPERPRERVAVYEGETFHGNGLARYEGDRAWVRFDSGAAYSVPVGWLRPLKAEGEE